MVRQSRSCFLMICFLTFVGCTLKTFDTIETGDKTALKSKMLIATQNSQFKNEVLSEIKKTLGEDISYIKVVDVKRLPNESADQYIAIVILNSCMAGRPDPRVESFIDDIPEKRKLVVLTTGRLDSWKPDSSEVDALTSASTMSETDAVAREIADKVRVIINSQKNI